MVLFSNKANQDLDDIYEGLLNWKKIHLERTSVINYVLDIIDVCASIDKTNYHANAQFEVHKKYGKKVFNYILNKNTTWYIIYDIDLASNTIYIQHITSNHVTITESE